MPPTSFEALREYICTMHALSGGIWRMVVVRPEDAVSLLAAANEGNALASFLLHAAGDTITQVGSSPTLCLLCDATCSTDQPPSATIAFMAEHPAADHCVSNVVCPDCAAMSNAALRARALEWYRKNLLPDLRVLSPMPPAGHA